jgi:hypothetical protein
VRIVTLGGERVVDVGDRWIRRKLSENVELSSGIGSKFHLLIE